MCGMWQEANQDLARIEASFTMWKMDASTSLIFYLRLKKWSLPPCVPSVGQQDVEETVRAYLLQTIWQVPERVSTASIRFGPHSHPAITIKPSFRMCLQALVMSEPSFAPFYSGISPVSRTRRDGVQLLI